MIDTSVWLECRIDEELKTAVRHLTEQHELRSSEIVEMEVEAAYGFLRRKRIEGADVLHELYLDVKKPVIKETRAVSGLAEEYASEAGKLGVATASQMKPDFTIVACAALDNVASILTLNRKTMASDRARLVYSFVNANRKLRTPAFVIGKEAIKRFAYA
ncbi:MAG: PIN domain-containing protein [Candidatus Aenigmarchaeota archaeon]|nr:PIN domain-containing protein [Candidatus Aenigmarchaeota archaeon]